MGHNADMEAYAGCIELNGDSDQFNQISVENAIVGARMGERPRFERGFS
jgi:hypothetical protein